MLVLSRKSTEEIVFPALGVTIRVLRTGANTVKLGIEAPPHLQVLRGELASCDALIAAIENAAQSAGTHDFRNQLNLVLLKLELLKRAEQKGLCTEQLVLIQDAANAMAKLDSELARHATPQQRMGNSSCKSRLLVVDDNVNERELLTAVLILQGFDVVSVADGVDAIAKLNDCHLLPHAILLDLEMPRLGGEQTLRCIRSDPRFMRLMVIGMSGRTPQVELLPDGLRGFDAWFSKPLQLQQLLDLVSRPRIEYASEHTTESEVMLVP